MDTQVGGSFLGEGKYGCVFTPPLLCSGQSPGSVSSTAVSKIGDTISIKNEVEIAKVLRTVPLSHNYFIYPLAHSYCMPAPLQQQVDEKGQVRKDLVNCDAFQTGSLRTFRMFQMPYGGVRYRRTTINLWNFGKHLLEALSLLLVSGVVHFDLHSSNIIVDAHRVPRILDWGLANLGPNATITDFSQVIESTFDVKYIQQPPEVPLFTQAYLSRSINDAMSQLIIGPQRREITNIVHEFLGIDKEVLIGQLDEFRRKTRFLERNLDFPAWWKAHWPTYDSWSLGVILLKIAYEQNKMKQLFSRPEYIVKGKKIKASLRGLLNFNCFDRFNAIQALAIWDSPNNPIIRRFGQKWLEKKAFT